MKRKWIWTAVVAGSISIGRIWGQFSGNQIDRDAVAAAEEQFGIELESQMVLVDDVWLHVVFAGPEDGKPVILLHGYPEFWYAWRGPMEVLARAGFRVIVPDQRGYNKSDKPRKVEDYRLDELAGDVVGLADALGYEKIFLAGHDFGGLVSWWTLMLYPDRISRFAIVNKPHPYARAEDTTGDDTISWYRTFLRMPWLPGYVARVGNWALLAKNLRATSQPGTFLDADLDQFRSAWDRDGAIHTMGAWYRANAGFSLTHLDGHIAVPSLMILAPDDAFSSIERGRRSSLFLQDGQVLELDAGTHWVIQECPQVIGDALTDFFSQP